MAHWFGYPDIQQIEFQIAQKICSFFQGILRFEDLADVPVVVLVNKIDVPGAASEEEVARCFQLHDLLTGKVS